MDITELVKENEKLKNEILELKEQLQNILMVILTEDIMKK
jgi:cell division septum initiation protein DivIVA